MRTSGTLRRVAIIASAGLIASGGLVAGALPAYAGHGHGPGPGYGQGSGHGHGKGKTLPQAVKVQKVVDHLEAFQAIADANGGNRQSGSPGYDAAASYVEHKLRKAGYDPIRQPFTYDQFVEGSTAFEQVNPTALPYEAGTDFDVVEYSGAGEVSAEIEAVDVNLEGDRASTSGCEAEDFADFTAGSIALVQRGTCDFRVKVENAAAAGAVGAVIFNQGNGEDRSGLLLATLAAPQVSIPVVGTTYALGETLALESAQEEVTVRVAVEASTRTVETFNVIADTRKGNPDKTVVVGAHLDGVGEGPGINDNASGSAAILETAIQLAKTKGEPQNRVRFAFWSGEEDGLLGSTHYVEQLTEAEIQQHSANLNFDMVGSTNFVRFVYDGDGDAFGLAGPDGSAEIEALFTEWFASQGLESAPTEFSGRSDYKAFIDAGIPAGGLFSGAEGIKTEEEAAIFGGTAGEAYDSCYHAACDTIENVSVEALDQFSDAIAHATASYADVKKHPGKGKGWGWGKGHGKGKGHPHPWDHFFGKHDGR